MCEKKSFRLWAYALVVCVSVSVLTYGRLFAEDQITFKGVVTEIAEDKSYIVLDDGITKTKLLTTEEFLEDSYLEVQDEIKAYGEKTSAGIELKDCTYDYDDYLGESIDDEESLDDTSLSDE